jgi:hypothetical protein
LKQACTALRRPDDGNMPGSMRVGALENDYNQVSTIR